MIALCALCGTEQLLSDSRSCLVKPIVIGTFVHWHIGTIVHWKLSRGGTHPFGSMAHDACDILGQAQGTGVLVYIVNALALALQFAILPLVWQHLQLHVRIL